MACCPLLVAPLDMPPLEDGRAADAEPLFAFDFVPELLAVFPVGLAFLAQDDSADKGISAVGGFDTAGFQVGLLSSFSLPLRS